MKKISQHPGNGNLTNLRGNSTMHNFQHKIPRGGSLELQIPGLKVLAKSKNPSISLGSWGTPRTRKAKNSVTFILSLDKWRCEGCGYEISDVFSVLRFYPFRILGKLSFWSQLSLRQLTSNTRLGNILLVLRSLLTLLFLSSILIFSGASNTDRPITHILFSFGLWVLFEIGIARSSLVLNIFSSFANSIKASWLLLTSAAFLSTSLDFLALSCLISIYSFTLGDLVISKVLVNFVFFVVAYFLLLVPALTLSYLVAWLNRNHRDFKHILPWFLRLLLFTIPIFSIGVINQFSLVKDFINLSPLTLPFSFLRIDQTISFDISLTMIISYVLNMLLLLYLYLRR